MIVKTLDHNDLPPITAPANKGQNLHVPSRPLSRGSTVVYESVMTDDLEEVISSEASTS